MKAPVNAPHQHTHVYTTQINKPNHQKENEKSNEVNKQYGTKDCHLSEMEYIFWLCD